MNKKKLKTGSIKKCRYEDGDRCEYQGQCAYMRYLEYKDPDSCIVRIHGDNIPERRSREVYFEGIGIGFGIFKEGERRRKK